MATTPQAGTAIPAAPLPNALQSAVHLRSLCRQRKVLLRLDFAGMSRTETALVRQALDDLPAARATVIVRGDDGPDHLEPAHSAAQRAELIDSDDAVLPIFIGTDNADDDSFAAAGRTGLSIAVGTDRTAGYPSPATYAVTDVSELVEFLRCLGGWLSADTDNDDAWTLVYDGYDPSQETLREALCTVGNGYFATRGAAPETRAGAVHYPGTYAAGVYNRLHDEVNGTTTVNESLVNLPNWLAFTFRIDGGAWFDIDAVSVLEYRQSMDLRAAILTRQIRFRDHTGRTTSVTQRRFAAMHSPHVGVLETIIDAEDWSGTLELRSTIDGDIANTGVARYRNLRGAHLSTLRTRELSADSVLLSAETSQSGIRVAAAVRTRIWCDGRPAAARYALTEDGRAIGHRITVAASRGQRFTVEKVVCMYTGRDVAIADPAAAATRMLAAQSRIAEIETEHRRSWRTLWDRLSIEWADRSADMQILRLHIMHLVQTVSPNSEDLDVGVPARGLHGEAYRGHIFWDEMFIFPVLSLRLPRVTRALLRYRSRRLPEARRAATEAGYAGALFPWQSGSDGREESPDIHLNPRSGRWNPDPSHRAHHIGIAVAYSCWHFYQVTGDLAYLIDYGAELIAEIARFWASRSTFDAQRQRYCINGVIGPDEFHTGYPASKYTGIDNNAYTNVMAVWVIRRALDALNALPLPSRLDLLEKLMLTDAELTHWDDVSRRMFVPFHDGFISQFEGYERLAEFDWAGYRTKFGDIARLDRILEAEGDDVNRYKAAKQADVLMLLYLLSSDELCELLSRLGYPFDPRRIPDMVDYYLARTSHGSTLSSVVHTWVLARANRDRAMEFFSDVLRSDIADIQGGTTAEGIHLGAMAGSVDLVQRCFTGLEFRDDRIVLSPCWPEMMGPLSFSIRYRGHHLHVEVSGRGAEISVAPREAVPVTVECRGETALLTAGISMRFPSTPTEQRQGAEYERRVGEGLSAAFGSLHRS